MAPSPDELREAMIRTLYEEDMIPERPRAEDLHTVRFLVPGQ